MDALPSQVPPEFHQHVASLQKEREDLLQIIELLTRSLHDLKTALRAKPLSASNDYEDAYWYPRSQWRLGVKRIHELETYIDELGLHVPEPGLHARTTPAQEVDLADPLNEMERWRVWYTNYGMANIRGISTEKRRSIGVESNEEGSTSSDRKRCKPSSDE